MTRLFARYLAASLLTTQALVSQFAWSAGAPAGWPMLGLNPQHTAYLNALNPSASTASQLGLNWMSNLHSADLGSPVIAFNTTLKAMVVYVGDENGDVFAFNEATGQQIWGVNLGLGNAMRTTPAVAPDGSVWVATTYGANVTKLDGASGQTLCSQHLITTIDASPMVATPPGGTVQVYDGTNDAAALICDEVAPTENNCAQEFAFQNFRTTPAGTWTTPAYSVNAAGTRGIVLFGTADPDSTEYALDARTGMLLWQRMGDNPCPPCSFDIGEAAAISAPGVNGVAHGMAFVSSKYGIMHGLDLTTGVSLWQTSMYPPGFTGTRDARSGPAFTGSAVVSAISAACRRSTPLRARCSGNFRRAASR